MAGHSTTAATAAAPTSFLDSSSSTSPRMTDLLTPCNKKVWAVQGGSGCFVGLGRMWAVRRPLRPAPPAVAPACPREAQAHAAVRHGVQLRHHLLQLLHLRWDEGSVGNSLLPWRSKKATAGGAAGCLHHAPGACTAHAALPPWLAAARSPAWPGAGCTRGPPTPAPAWPRAGPPPAPPQLPPPACSPAPATAPARALQGCRGGGGSRFSMVRGKCLQLGNRGRQPGPRHTCAGAGGPRRRRRSACGLAQLPGRRRPGQPAEPAADLHAVAAAQQAHARARLHTDSWCGSSCAQAAKVDGSHGGEP